MIGKSIAIAVGVGILAAGALSVAEHHPLPSIAAPAAAPALTAWQQVMVKTLEQTAAKLDIATRQRDQPQMCVQIKILAAGSLDFAATFAPGSADRTVMENTYRSLSKDANRVCGF